MTKYEPLQRHLQASEEFSLEFSFADIEEILGFTLPASARRYAAWWSNSDGSHVQAQAWLAAGYETSEVDIPREQLKFSLVGRAKGLQEMQQATFSQSADSKPPLKRHPLFGSMKGTTIIMPGVDLSEPADPDWGKIYDDDYDHGVITNPRKKTS